MKRAIGIVVAALAMASGIAVGQDGHAGHHGAAATDAASSEGEVRKVDRDAGKVTLRHGPIRNLDMPPMTMVFQVKDRALLDKVKTGDKVRFVAEEIAGAYVVTSLEPQR